MNRLAAAVTRKNLFRAFTQQATKIEPKLAEAVEANTEKIAEKVVAAAPGLGAPYSWGWKFIYTMLTISGSLWTFSGVLIAKDHTALSWAGAEIEFEDKEE
eukprot:TRINITY_DN4424_c0_g1_i1.p1 TRINITY_DN4424_c0_g1~~TRINITY_DN4424_c0_g1_i1.p1  ORF type:complete len:101 (+),score=27.88 TRINITY_DN4424_c0_g1_i1:54-356(+)